MNSNALIQTFFDLVKIDSPSRSEAHLASYCESYLKTLGFEVRFDDSQAVTQSNTGNLIATLGGSKPGHIVLSAHLDCVEPCRGVEPVIDKGVIRSAGDTILGADDKAGIAAIFEALRSVLATEAALPTITVLLTTCEELSLLGASCLSEEIFADCPSCFVFDADGKPGTIIVGSPYHYSFKATFSGRGAHAGVEPEQGISSIQMASHAIELMNLGRLDDCSTANVGIIEGGHETNIVPDYCVIQGECRSLYKDRVEEIRSQITGACSAGAKCFGGEANIEWELDYPGLLYEEGDQLVQFLAHAARQVGLEPRFSITGGGADTNILGAKGARAVTLGIGMAAFHSLDEHIEVQDLEDIARFCEAIITSS
jgi:tripeptide aminopeptidase